MDFRLDHQYICIYKDKRCRVEMVSLLYIVTYSAGRLDTIAMTKSGPASLCSQPTLYLSLFLSAYSVRYKKRG